jgi:acyl transferase domain-containing protein
MPIGAVSFSRWGMMAKDGRCKAFDARADGFVRGEGAGVVVLKRLRDALADRDPIWALIRGSAVNQDGRSTVLTAPSALAQQAAIQAALRQARVAPSDITYVEAHGTGTSLGDPIEVEALTAVIGAPRPSGAACVLGSVKTNIGHLEAAAGVAGLIKAALALDRGQIPANLHFDTLNPNICLEGTPFVVPTRLGPWPSGVERRFAAVSSFGFGGTNAHVVLEAAPEPRFAVDAAAAPDAARAQLVPLSAHSPSALSALASALREALAPAGALHRASLEALSYTAGVRRSHHAHRLSVVARSVAELSAHLERFLSGEDDGRLAVSVASRGAPPRLVFVFSGQGTQWPTMARDLFDEEPVFRAALERCDAILRSLGGPSILEEMSAEASRSRLDDTEIAQPVILALQVALAALWRSWGIEPDAVVGHSVGEIAAAHVGGMLRLEDAARIVLHRGRLMQRATGRGRMAAIDLPVASVRELVAGYGARLSIAAINSPRSTVIAGEPSALSEALLALRERQIPARRIEVAYAFHSAQIEPLRDPLIAALGDLSPEEGTIPMYSTLHGRVVQGRELRADYWGHSIVEPVRFADAVGALLARGHDAFLEIGSHPALLRPITECLHDRGLRGLVLPSLHRNRPARADLLASLGALFVHGYPLDWVRLHGGAATIRPIRLPSYRFHGTRHWLDAPSEARSIERAKAAVHADGARPSPPFDPCYESTWQPALEAAPAPRVTAEPGSVLIFADRSGVGAALARALAASGQRCILVRPGETFHLTADGEATIHPERREDVHRLLHACRQGGAPPLRGVVHLYSLDIPTNEQEPSTALRAAQRLGCGAALLLLQALAAAPEPAPQVFWVTRGAEAVGPVPLPVAAAQSPLWGIAKCAALEHPELWGGLIDLDPTAPPDEIAGLVAEIEGRGGDEDYVAFRGGRRYVARLVQVDVPAGPSATVSWSAEGTYLITGGLGTLGLLCARWMVERGARDLILLGRRGLPERSLWPTLGASDPARAAVDAIAAIEEAGATVEAVAVDVADAAQMAALLAPLASGPRRLRGIIHAAGVSMPAKLASLTPETLYAVLRPKVEGAWILHTLTRELRLDCFICFSSIAAVWGSIELGPYAAGNHFLDALARRRRALGLSATSVGWGPFAVDGMATHASRERLAQLGIEAIEPQRALSILERLLSRDATHVAVAVIDWGRFKPAYEARLRRPFLERVGPRPSAEDEPRGEADARAALLLHLTDAPASERLDALITHLTREVGAVLGFDPPTAIDPERRFFDMGMDSLMAVRLNRRLRAALGQPVPATVAFDYPSIQALAEHLLRDVLHLTAPRREPVASEPGDKLDQALARLEQLSDAEAMALLEKRRLKKRKTT